MRYKPRETTLKAIQVLGANNPNEEICGFVLSTHNKDFWIRSENVSSNKKYSCTLSQKARDTLSKLLRQYPQATVTVYHTHVRGVSGFSKADLEQIKEAQKQGFLANWYVYHIRTRIEEWFIPNQEKVA
jgi:proteasome lid subunit RPN8/RPN11